MKYENINMAKRTIYKQHNTTQHKTKLNSTSTTSSCWHAETCMHACLYNSHLNSIQMKIDLSDCFSSRHQHKATNLFIQLFCFDFFIQCCTFILLKMFKGYLKLGWGFVGAKYIPKINQTMLGQKYLLSAAEH